VESGNGTSPDERVADFHLTGPLDRLAVVPEVQLQVTRDRLQGTGYRE
jgi:hypothetical protein